MTLDIEHIAQQIADRGFHMGLTRTRNRRGVWECRIWPASAIAEASLDGGTYPYVRANTLDEAIANALKKLPEEVRSAIVTTGSEP